jgi:hypothetical protein
VSGKIVPSINDKVKAGWVVRTLDETSKAVLVLVIVLIPEIGRLGFFILSGSKRIE